MHTYPSIHPFTLLIPSLLCLLLCLLPAQGADEIIIVEGEIDKLSLDEALQLVSPEQQQKQQPPFDHQQQQVPTPVSLQPADSSTDSSMGVQPVLRGRHWKTAVLSVPAGAPAVGETKPGSLERKFQFVRYPYHNQSTWPLPPH
jgi:hypothetical protein